MKKIITCHDKNNKKYKISSNKLRFRPSIYGVIIKNNKILLSPRWDGYDFPGGGVNLDENLEEALIREVWEETGYNVRMGKPVYCGTSFFTPKENATSSDEYWNCIVIYYTCKIISGKISDEHFDTDEKVYTKKAEWIDVKDALKLSYYNGVDAPRLIKETLKIK